MALRLLLVIRQHNTLPFTIIKLTALPVAKFSALSAWELLFHGAKTICISTVSNRTVAKPSMVCIESATRSDPGITIRSCTLAQNSISCLITKILYYVSVRRFGWRYRISFILGGGYILQYCSVNWLTMIMRYSGWRCQHKRHDRRRPLKRFSAWGELEEKVKKRDS